MAQGLEITAADMGPVSGYGTVGDLERALVALSESHDATFGDLFNALNPSAKESLMRGREEAFGAALALGRKIRQLGAAQTNSSAGR